MSDIGIFIFGMFIFGVAICSTLIVVLAGNVTPAENVKTPETKTDVSGNASVVPENG